MKKRTYLDKIEQIFLQLHVGERFDLSAGQTDGIVAVSHLLEHFFGVSVLTFQISEVDADRRYFTGVVDHFCYLGMDYRQAPVKVLFRTDEPDTIWIELLFSVPDAQKTEMFSWMKDTLSLQTEQARCFVIYKGEGLDESDREYFFQSFRCTGGSGQELPWLTGQSVCGNRWQLSLDQYHREEETKLKFQDLQRTGDVWGKLEGLIPEPVRSALEQVELTGFLAEGDPADDSGCDAQEMQIRAGGESGPVWAITKDLTIEELSLKASERRVFGRKREELAISGAAGLWGTKIPVTARWDLEGTYYSLCVGNGKDKIEIGSLDELACLVKRSFKAEDLLPLDYSFGKMYVKKVFLEMDRGAGNIREFSFCVGLEEHWRIFDIFEIKGLELYVSCSEADFFVLTGELGIAGADFALEIRKGETFQIAGYMLNADGISLQDLLESFSIEAGDLPQIVLEDLRFSCRPQEDGYSFSAAVKWDASSEDLWQFESVSADFSLDAKKGTDGEWKMDVDISGRVCFQSFIFLYITRE